MDALVKIVVALGLVVPLGAFVAGSLAASGAEDPAPRETIVVRDSPTRSAAPHPHSSPHAGPHASPGGDATGRPSGGTDDGPEVVTPSVHDLGDDHGGDHSGGHDSGGHGSSGHGSDDSGGRHGSDDSGGGGHG